jgi:hypothetical protein
MSDEFEQAPENHYSAFWPLLILVGGFFLWYALQDYALNNQRAAYAAQFQDKQFQSTLMQAQNVSTKYQALMKDLFDTAQKDPAAADIVKAAIAANLIQVRPPDTNAAANPAPPSK